MFDKDSAKDVQPLFRTNVCCIDSAKDVLPKLQTKVLYKEYTKDALPNLSVKDALQGLCKRREANTRHKMCQQITCFPKSAEESTNTKLHIDATSLIGNTPSTASLICLTDVSAPHSP